MYINTLPINRYIIKWYYTYYILCVRISARVYTTKVYGVHCYYVISVYNGLMNGNNITALVYIIPIYCIVLYTINNTVLYTYSATQCCRMSIFTLGGKTRYPSRFTHL